MINRLHRFHGYNALRFVYKQGRTARMSQTGSDSLAGPLVTLRYAPNPRRQTYRLAVVVSKKQSKSAVVRNRIRRRLYETARVVIPGQIPDIGGYDLVLTVMSDQLATVPQKDINNILSRLLQIAKIGKG